MWERMKISTLQRHTQLTWPRALKIEVGGGKQSCSQHLHSPEVWRWPQPRVSLQCAVCSQFKESMRNYCPVFNEGANNVQTTAFEDHTGTDMHAHAMVLFKEQHAWDITEHSPIGAALLQWQCKNEWNTSSMYVGYMIAKENLSLKWRLYACWRSGKVLI